MAKNEVMVITEQDIKEKLALGESEIDTLKYLVANAGIEMDEETKRAFISSRNVQAVSIARLNEFKCWCKKTVDYLDAIFKHAFNVGTYEEFPANVKLKNNGSTHKFKDGAAAIVADTLLKKRLVTKEQLFAVLSVDNIAKASGLKKEKLMEMFPDVIIEEKKSATLIIS